MTRRRAPAAGFTLIEMVVVVAVIAALAAVAGPLLSRSRPRATLATTTAELQSFIHFARQSALASGDDVAVLVFPDWARGQQQGLLVLYRDGSPARDFFNGGAVRFNDYNPDVLKAGTRSGVIGTMELPAGVTVGPLAGTGVVPKAPLDKVKVDSFCSFCTTTAGARRGAIRFDPHGRATFYGNGTTTETPVTVTGGASLSLQADGLAGGRTLVITAVAGTVQALENG
jgi:prepilin-type N-terminal cleavage/methylation domain-containing protein